MRIGRIFAIGMLALLLGACASTAELRAADEVRCRGYGFRKGTDAFSKCLLDIDLNRDADRRASLNYSYGPGLGWYGRPWRYW
jgi:hypothetical protein